MRICPQCGEVYPNRATRCRAHEVTLEPWTEFATAAFTDVEHRALPVATPFDLPRPVTPDGGDLALADTPRSGDVPAARGSRRRRVIGGRYRLGRELGVGGYGVVFAADDQLTGDRVAIKLLAPSATANAESLTRFHREAIATSRIRHPHIVDVADFDVDPDGGHFIVMEYLDGRDLSEALADDGPLAPARALAIAAQCARGLAAAHRVGVLHRDLKPANIYLVRRADGGEAVKIIDFGVSKLTRLAGDYTDVTSASKVVGTPCYMAPEQARGRELDGRCDVYALGVVLFEMLVGQRPFTGRAPLEILVQHVKAPRVAPSTLRPELAACPGLDALVVRALAVDPGDRFASMTAFSDALLACLGRIDPEAADRVATTTDAFTDPGEALTCSSEVSTPRAPSARSRWVGLALGAVAIATVAVVGLGGRVARGPEVAPPPVAPAAPPPAVTAVDAPAPAPAPAPARAPALAPAPAPAPAPPVAPAPRVVRLTSSPAGATVRRDGVRLGVTPLTIAVDGDGPAPTVSVEARGHRPRRVVLAAGRDAVDVTLTPLPPPRRVPRGAAELGVAEW
ncbi:MAG: serine/threonine protein kinase [Myxococcales bacterium]|nr:serine/threonine protein kinase [Myxococcales bacterium]